MISSQLTIAPPTVEGYAPLPARTFDIIYADPNWAYNDKGLNRGGAERHYRTSPIDQICSLPVSSIAANDSVLFLWATWSTLPDALRVIKAWGFTYKTCAFCWVKVTGKGTYAMGGGGYTRANSEPCLLATRGNILDRLDRGVLQIIETDQSEALLAPRGKHSAKPPEARDRIVELFGDRSRIELFARDAAPGWECWGDQAPAAWREAQ